MCEKTAVTTSFYPGVTQLIKWMGDITLIRKCSQHKCNFRFLIKNKKTMIRKIVYPFIK